MEEQDRVERKCDRQMLGQSKGRSLVDWLEDQYKSKGVIASLYYNASAVNRSKNLTNQVATDSEKMPLELFVEIQPTSSN